MTRQAGLAAALEVLRTLSRIVTDTARVETPCSWVFVARYRYLVKYNLSLSRAVVEPVDAKVSPAPRSFSTAAGVEA